MFRWGDFKTHSTLHTTTFHFHEDDDEHVTGNDVYNLMIHVTVLKNVEINHTTFPLQRNLRPRLATYNAVQWPINFVNHSGRSSWTRLFKLDIDRVEVK